MRIRLPVICLIWVGAIVFSACRKEAPLDQRTLMEKLMDLPGVDVRIINPPHGHDQAFELTFTQPLDHANPDGPSFEQRAYLHHNSDTGLMVFAPSGYAVSEQSAQELAIVLHSNLVTVTHRFFEGARPEPYNYEFLTIEQAAADHHRIVSLLKQIYQGIWISSGASKSGQAVLFHRRFYPGDTEATVAYVAPIVFGTEDQRFIAFMDQVGTEPCRTDLENYERRLLMARDSMLPRFVSWYSENGYTLSIDPNEAFEYAVLEYHYAFWQFHNHDCSTIPNENASYDEMFEHLESVLWMAFFSDYYMSYFSPYYYQAMTETGYPAYIKNHLSDLLTYATEPGGSFFIVEPVATTYDPAPIQDIYEWLRNDGDHIIYIYGEIDPWSAGMIELNGAANAIRVVQTGADHSVRISELDEKDQVITTLENWLGIRIDF